MSDEARTEVKTSGSYRPRMHWIEAVRWTGTGGLEGGCPPWLSKILGSSKTPDEVGGVMRLGDGIHVGTPRGILVAEPGDWLVRGPCGALGVIPGSIFAAIYEPVPETQNAPQSEDQGA